MGEHTETGRRASGIPALAAPSLCGSGCPGLWATGLTAGSGPSALPECVCGEDHSENRLQSNPSAASLGDLLRGPSSILCSPLLAAPCCRFHPSCSGVCPQAPRCSDVCCLPAGSAGKGPQGKAKGRGSALPNITPVSPTSASMRSQVGPVIGGFSPKHDGLQSGRG